MNKKILYKLLLIFALLACTLLITNTKSFAAGVSGVHANYSDVYNSSYIESSTSKFQAIYDIIDNNQNIFKFTSSELPTYQIILKYEDSDDGTVYDFMAFSVPVYINTNKSTSVSIYYQYKYNSSPYKCNTYHFDVRNSCFYTGWCGYSIIEDSSSSNTDYFSSGFSGEYEIVYSNYDILDENGEVVFQQPPQVQETTLAPIVEGVEAKKTLAEVVGILPVVLVVVVGLMAIRKALKFLKRTLIKT